MSDTQSSSTSSTSTALVFLGGVVTAAGVGLALRYFLSAPSNPTTPRSLLSGSTSSTTTSSSSTASSSSSTTTARKTSARHSGVTIDQVRQELARLRDAEKRRLDITLHRKSVEDVSLQDLISMYEDLAKMINQLPLEEVSHDERLHLLAQTNRGSGNAYRLLSSYTRNQAFSYLESAASLLHDSITELQKAQEEEGDKDKENPETMAKLVKRLEERAVLFNDIGKLYSESAQFTKAREAYTSALNLHTALNSTSNHSNTEAFTTISLGRLSQAEGKIDEAEQYFESSYQCYRRDFTEQPHFLVPLLELMEMYLAVNRMEKALEVKKRLLVDHAKDVETINRLEKKYPKALAFVKKN